MLAITGWPLLRSAGVGLRVLRPNMDLPIVIAAGSAHLYSTGAVLLGEMEVYFDVAVVIVFVVSLVQLQLVRCAIEIPQAGAWSNSKLLSPKDRLKLHWAAGGRIG
ncbi:MAG: hypothetical protein BRD55_04285 [Bacteroidetes bacterium SW_9_63_38]|nr:MAG: hypothetical protein BRD55_04285 [Bacteroidetes bacterium SW_9_63_38]